MCESPDDSGDAEAAGYVWIFIDVARIIVVNKIVPEGLAKNEPRNCCEENADADSQPAAVRLRQSYCARVNMVHVRAKISQKRQPKVSVCKSRYNLLDTRPTLEHPQKSNRFPQA